MKFTFSMYRVLLVLFLSCCTQRPQVNLNDDKTFDYSQSYADWQYLPVETQTDAIIKLVILFNGKKVFDLEKSDRNTIRVRELMNQLIGVKRCVDNVVLERYNESPPKIGRVIMSCLALGDVLD